MRPALLLFFFVLLAAIQPARAEWTRGHGERLFGPEMSEEEACSMAEKKAREDALKKVTGEKLSSEDLMVCSEQSKEASCDLNSITWSTIEGDIKGVRNKTVTTQDGVSGYRVCTVELEADVGIARGKPDPGFDMTVRLNERTFRSGDKLIVSISPSQPMYISVFQWLPYEKGDDQVLRIFPNALDPKNHFESNGTVPTKEGQAAYDMVLEFPKGHPPKRRLVDEYLMIVGTKDKIPFRDSYRLDEFKGRLIEIPRPVSRLVRRGYAVVKPQ